MSLFIKEFPKNTAMPRPHPISLLVCCHLLGSPAFAEEWVLYADENKDVAAARVVVAGESDLANLKTIDLGATKTGLAPQLVGVSSLQLCDGDPTTLREVRERLTEAEGSVSFMDHTVANEQLELLDERLACLVEPIIPALGARGAFLAGVIALEQDDKPKAWEYFNQTTVMDPNARWDDNFNPAGKAIFSVALAEVKSAETVKLDIVPPPVEGQLRIDGNPIPKDVRSIDLLPGRHLVQWSGEHGFSGWLSAEPGISSTLLVPQLIPKNALYWVDTDENRSLLSPILATFAEPGDVVNVTVGDGVWRTVVGTEEWEELLEVGEPPPVEEPEESEPVVADHLSTETEIEPSGQHAQPPTWTKSIKRFGLITSASGLVVAMGNYKNAKTHWETMASAPDDETYNQALNAYESSEFWFVTGEALILSGAASAIAGLLIERTHLTPVVGAGTIGIATTWQLP